MSTKKAESEEQTETSDIPTVADETNSYGDIKINHSVVASIVKLAALEVDGVYSVGGGGFAENITEYFKGTKESDRGVRVAEDEAGQYMIEIRVVLLFGVELAKAAVAVQENVKTTLTRMTMKGVSRIDVIIDGVQMENQSEPRDEYEVHTD